MAEQYSLLSSIATLAELRGMPFSDLPALAQEIRDFLISHINLSGGHFASSLGVVELTIALHVVFNTPEDQLIWDVGHQTYAHKVLTGRRELMQTFRKQAGIGGFLKRSESLYDSFGAGHSSTAMSAALGMALAAHLQGIKRSHVAIVGDGALTAGLAYEALNHLGNTQADLLIIVNDNAFSIAHNTGYQAGYPHPLKDPDKAQAFFTSLGLTYTGVTNGHDLSKLIIQLKHLKLQSGPQVLHITTQKGKGYPPAELDPIKYHAVNPGFLVSTAKVSAAKPTYSQIFGQWLCEKAAHEQRLVAITPNMREGSGMIVFAERYPQRYFDVGIAEQHSVTLAAGLACAGLKPVVAIYATFLQRAYDQVIHDVALQNLPVIFAIDRAGIVGADGATHMGQFDISFLRCIPNLIIMTPAHETECYQLLNTAYNHPGPTAIRYPRGAGPGKQLTPYDKTLIPIGKAEICLEGSKDCVILSFGSLLLSAMQAGAKVNATVINMRFVKPLDTELLDTLINNSALLVTVEENAVAGGAGSAVNEYMLSKGFKGRILNLGLPDHFIEQGHQVDLLHQCGLDAEGISKAILGQTSSRQGDVNGLAG